MFNYAIVAFIFVSTAIQDEIMIERTRKPYLFDLTDELWNLIAPLIPPKIGKGENRKVDLREAMNGILYVLRNGCQWDYLPHDLLPKVSYGICVGRVDHSREVG